MEYISGQKIVGTLQLRQDTWQCHFACVRHDLPTTGIQRSFVGLGHIPNILP